MRDLDLDIDAAAQGLAELEQAAAERDRLRDALILIAEAESGYWGRVARAALYPERKAA